MLWAMVVDMTAEGLIPSHRDHEAMSQFVYHAKRAVKQEF